MSGRNEDLIWISVILIVCIGVVLVVTVGLGGGYMSGMMGMMGYGWGFMVLIPIVFLVLIAFGVYYLVTGSTGTRRIESKSGETAFEILRERYAKGEITRDQFLKMKRELEQ
jgi:putative membrane protein